jgi:hypothetical protein
MDRPRQSLATAHGVLMFLALVALASLAYSWPDQGPSATAAWLATPALCLQTAVLLYLASTAIVELNVSQVLRDGQSPQSALGLPTLLGHLWVLIVTLATAWRGAASRTYLAGLDWQLATLAAASLLALVLLVATRRVDEPSGKPDTAVESPISDLKSERQLRWLGWLHASICLAVIFAIWFMETRPLEASK